ncbi:MAG: rhomboid family intramembrane serine protease [Planctomycetes bacterium]|nr:rhomboid family intramembrane serine protease [Planctomycetota bacterium]
MTWILVVAWLLMAGLTGVVSPEPEAMLRYGAHIPLLVPDEPWRLLTASFLHFGFLHLGLNAACLGWVGPGLERALGGLRFGLLYVVAAIGGSLLSTVTHNPLDNAAGGSGAVFGCFGAMLGLLMRLGRSQFEFLDYHGPRSLVTLIAGNLVLGFLIPHIDNAAHVGGMLSGFVFVHVFATRGRARPDVWTWTIRAGWLALFGAMFLYAVRPVLSIGWSARRALDAPTSELRAVHEDRLRRLGMSSEAVRNALRDALEEYYGDLGAEYGSRLFR